MEGRETNPRTGVGFGIGSRRYRRASTQSDGIYSCHFHQKQSSTMFICPCKWRGRDFGSCLIPEPGLGIAISELQREFARKVRTLSGNYQLLQLAPWLLTSANPIRFEFVSHKLLRLIVPFALAGIRWHRQLLHTPLYRVALVLQAAFYGLSVLAMAQVKKGPLARMADAVFTFVVLNTRSGGGVCQLCFGTQSCMDSLKAQRMMRMLRGESLRNAG